MHATLLGLHIGAALLALASGGGGLAVTKGSPLHRLMGRTFVYSMVVMAASAAPLAYASGVPMDVLSSFLVLYLVGSSWCALRPLALRIELPLVLLGLGTMLAYTWLAWLDVNSPVQRPGVPKGVGFVFATVLALALAGDGRRLAGGHGRSVPRHVWRMCFALFMATGSFFLSRASLFPAALQNTGLLPLLGVLPVLIMAFWALRLRLRPPQCARHSRNAVPAR